MELSLFGELTNIENPEEVELQIGNLLGDIWVEWENLFVRWNKRLLN